ncbi:MAG TPA: hypothetical protein PLG56_09765 [Lacunisphaera sp.]|nr:hypothetical protein [Lacunisphaera sp.]
MHTSATANKIVVFQECGIEVAATPSDMAAPSSAPPRPRVWLWRNIQHYEPAA